MIKLDWDPERLCQLRLSLEIDERGDLASGLTEGSFAERSCTNRLVDAEPKVFSFHS